MPNVPNVPGVPALTSYSTEPFVLMTEDDPSVAFASLAPTWGIYLDGQPAFDFNSTVSFEFKQDWTISDYPVENGGFQSYDKVQLPFDVRVTISSGGSEIERQALLEAVAAAALTTDLYDVVTPEATYSSCNIAHYDYRRTAANGVGMIVIDIWFVEIRVTATTAYSTTQRPDEAGQQGAGNVQPQTPNSYVQQGFSAGGFPN